MSYYPDPALEIDRLNRLNSIYETIISRDYATDDLKLTARAMTEANHERLDKLREITVDAELEDAA